MQGEVISLFNGWTKRFGQSAVFHEVRECMDAESFLIFDMNDPDIYPAVWGMTEPFVAEGRDHRQRGAEGQRHRDRGQDPERASTDPATGKGDRDGGRQRDRDDQEERQRCTRTRATTAAPTIACATAATTMMSAATWPSSSRNPAPAAANVRVAAASMSSTPTRRPAMFRLNSVPSTPAVKITAPT